MWLEVRLQMLHCLFERNKDDLPKAGEEIDPVHPLDSLEMLSHLVHQLLEQHPHVLIVLMRLETLVVGIATFLGEQILVGALWTGLNPTYLHDKAILTEMVRVAQGIVRIGRLGSGARLVRRQIATHLLDEIDL